MKFLQSAVARQLLVATLLSAGTQSALAEPYVRVSTTFGDFTIDLLQDEAPATVNNFLGYVDRGDYSRLLVHRLDDDFVFQAGSHKWMGDCVTGQLPPACGPALIPVGPTVQNEPGISNTRGTLAMAKIGDLPDSATSQWFVNLADNSANLDNQNGGFTVFARVLGDGMAVADRINALPVIAVSTGITQLPVRDFNTATDPAPLEKNLVMLNAWRVNRFSSALHVFEYGSARLSTYVNAGALGNLSLTMRVVEDTTQTIFQIDPQSIIPLAIAPEGMATFSDADQRLRIPSVEVNNNGQVSVLNNVVLRMIDAGTLRLVLESFEQQ
ncbi:MAG: peptidylprolyl isomerase [Gammaproteobacteria bacterium]|nr:peptidylprolyl isomerase [Gammaproteobacteria bacterium]